MCYYRLRARSHIDPLGLVMFRGKFLIGCIFIVSGIAWPTVSILRGLTKYSDVCRTAVAERREVQPIHKQEILYDIEQGSASILCGFLMGLFGIGLALGTKLAPLERPSETLVNTKA